MIAHVGCQDTHQQRRFDVREKVFVTDCAPINLMKVRRKTARLSSGQKHTGKMHFFSEKSEAQKNANSVFPAIFSETHLFWEHTNS